MEIKYFKNIILSLSIFTLSSLGFAKDCFSYKGVITGVEKLEGSQFRIQVNNDYDFSYFLFSYNLEGVQFEREIKLSKADFNNNSVCKREYVEYEIQKDRRINNAIKKEKKKLFRNLNKVKFIESLNTNYIFYGVCNGKKLAIISFDDGDYIYDSLLIQIGKNTNIEILSRDIITAFQISESKVVLFSYDFEKDISYIAEIN